MTRLFKYLNGRALFLAIAAMLLMVLEVVCDLKQPEFLADIIDIGIATGDQPYILDMGGKMLLFAFLGLIGGASCSILSSASGIKMGENMRGALFGHIQKLSFREVDQFKTTSLITRLTNDVSQVQNMTMMGLRMLIRAPFTCILGIVFAARRSTELAKILLFAIPLIVVVVLIVSTVTVPLFKKMQRGVDDVNTVMRENLLGVRVIKAFCMEKKQANRFEDVNTALMNISVTAMNRMLILWPILSAIMNFALVAVFWYGGILAERGAVATGDLIAFANYMTQILMSMLMVMMVMLNVARAKASADRLNEVFDTDSSIKYAENPQHADGYALSFSGVSFGYYDTADNVLTDINFELAEGETLGIIGTTGSGKSTLVHLIPRLYDGVYK